jgi:chromosomal replication initiation ATPase DnaA
VADRYRPEVPAEHWALARALAAEFGFRLSTLRGPKRSRALRHARRELGRKLLASGLSLKDVGLVLSRHKTTVIYIIKPDTEREAITVDRKIREHQKQTDPLVALEYAQTVGEEFAALRRMRAMRRAG